MFTTRRMIGLLAAVVGLLGIWAGTVGAQGGEQLVTGQPVAVTLNAAGETVRLGYSLGDNRAVSFQALSQVAQPTLTILRDGEVVAEQLNGEGALSILLNAYLPGGEYEVEIGAAQGGTGSIIVAIQSETPIVPAPLNVDSPIQSIVNAQAPLAVYAFGALPEPAYLYADSLAQVEGLRIRLRNLTTGRVSAEMGADLWGTRLTIPSGDAQYQLEITSSSTAIEHPYRLCLSLVSADTCGSGVPQAPVTVPPQAPAACAVTPALAGGANIRQTTSVDAPILAGLPGGAVASVLGISPDRAWFQVSFNGVVGWVAGSAVVASGDCAAVPVSNPPALPAVPTAIPATQPPAPPQPPAPTQTPAPSGPCLATFSADEMVYTRPEILPDYIFDQVVATGELILVARWNANPSWYKTSYNGWWLNAPGTAGTLTGGCDSLPLVAWP